MAENNTNNTLLFQEIDEEVRAERMRAWWQRFGSWVVGACVLAVLATIGYQYEKNRHTEANQQVTSVLLSSNDSLDRGQNEAAAKQLLEFPESADNVVLLARLKAAYAYTNTGTDAENLKKAKAQYEIVAKSASQPALASYAKLQLGQYDAIAKDAPFAPLAQELQAISLHQQGKNEEAIKLLRSVQMNPEAPASARTRAAELEAAFQ